MTGLVDIIGDWLFPTRAKVTRKLAEADTRRHRLVQRMDYEIGRLDRAARMSAELTAVEGRMRGRPHGSIT